MLLNVDGLDKKWNKGVKSIFEGELGWHAPGDVETYSSPLIFRRVNSGKQGEIRQYDSSTLGRGTEIDICRYAKDVEAENRPSNGKKVRLLSVSNRKLSVGFFFFFFCFFFSSSFLTRQVIILQIKIAVVVETPSKPNHRRTEPPTAVVMSEMLVIACTTCWRHVFCQGSDRYKIQEEKCLGRRVLSRDKIRKSDFHICVLYFVATTIENSKSLYKTRKLFSFVFCILSTTRNDLSEHLHFFIHFCQIKNLTRNFELRVTVIKSILRMNGCERNYM